MSPAPRKRRRTDDYSLMTSSSSAEEIRSRRSAFLASLNRGVSPPASSLPGTTRIESAVQVPSQIATSKSRSLSPMKDQPQGRVADASKCSIIQSPFKLTCIRDLPADANVDTVSIRDILGDVMLKEVWLFDFLYDVDWVMQQFDPDIQPIVSVVLVHGSWRRDDPNGIHINEASKRYPNVKVVTAYMPEIYGCHHSKCMVLLRHDDLVQIIVHTANMIEQDWRNLAQGVWLSPLLPRQAHYPSEGPLSVLPAIGTGARFKRDFMAYLQYYSHRTASLVSQLKLYDFTAIRAALIAHVPMKFDGKETDPSAKLWGWPALKRALRSISSYKSTEANHQNLTVPHIICQVSSIASLSDKWIRDTLYSALAETSPTTVLESRKNLKEPSFTQSRPKFSFIFPTPIEIRTCLDGYAAGSSIHCKLQSAAQRKQFEFMRPNLCHWNSHSDISATANINSTAPVTTGEGVRGRALRGPAAPHIKTFVRFSDASTHKEIDWALLTSANLSTQAWGTAAQSGSGEVKVSSYELGVLIWPDLFLEGNVGEEGREGGEEEGKRKRKGIARMLPTFGSDTPTASQIREVLTTTTSTSTPTETARKAHKNQAEEEVEKHHQQQKEEKADDDNNNNNNNNNNEPVIIIGLRIPYDLPLTPYSPQDKVWSTKSSYPEPDVFGRVWNI